MCLNLTRKIAASMKTNNLAHQQIFIFFTTTQYALCSEYYTTFHKKAYIINALL